MRTKQLNIKPFQYFFLCACLVAASGCAKFESAMADTDAGGALTAVEIAVALPDYVSKAVTIDDDAVKDLNIFIVGENGLLEQHLFRDFRYSDTRVKTELIVGREYGFYVIANSGYSMSEVTGDALTDLRYHLRYADSFAGGLPMYGQRCAKIGPTASDNTIDITLRRMVSKVSLTLDRSALNKNIDFHIMKASVGNCPRNAAVFGPSSVRSTDDLFVTGFHCDGADKFSLYLLENLQGKLDRELCSYIELDVDYRSDRCWSAPGKGLKYRFYIRENNGYNVERNCHYHVTVRPRADGLLCEDSWRLDKSSLIEAGGGNSGKPYLVIDPDGSEIDGQYYAYYYRMSVGGSMHFGLKYSPASMQVTLRKDLVEDERTEGRALYTMDSDGRGFTVKSLGKPCVSMMEIAAGPPLNDYELIIIEIG